MKDWFLQRAMEQIAIYIKGREDNRVYYSGSMAAMADAIGLYLIHQHSDVYCEIRDNEEDYDTYISFKIHPDEHYDEMMDLLKKYFQ